MRAHDLLRKSCGSTTRSIVRPARALRHNRSAPSVARGARPPLICAGSGIIVLSLTLHLAHRRRGCLPHPHPILAVVVNAYSERGTCTPVVGVIRREDIQRI